MIAKPDLHKWFSALRQTMLAISLEQGRLVAWRCVRLGLGAWQVDRREEFALEQQEPSGDALVTPLRPLLLRWGLPPGTPVVLVLPPQLGGCLTLTAPAEAKGRDWVAAELTRLLPFATKELDFGSTLRQVQGKTLAEVVWLPRGWLADVRGALAKLGLKLDEVLSRAQLLAPLPAALPLGLRLRQLLPKQRIDLPAVQTVATLEAVSADTAYFHCYVDGLVLRSRRLAMTSSRELAAAVALELFSLDAEGVRVDALQLSGLSPEVRELLSDDFRGTIHFQAAATDLGAAFCAAWQRDVHGIWLMPGEKREIFASLYKAGYVIAGVGTVLAVAMSMAASSAEEEVGQLEGDARRLKPKYQKVVAVETEAVGMSRLTAAIDGASKAPTPLDALYGVYEVLPETAWVTRFSWRADGVLVVAGHGLSSVEVAKRLQTQAGFSAVRAADAVVAPAAPAASGTAAPSVVPTAGDALAFQVECRWQAPGKPVVSAPASAAPAAPVSPAPATAPAGAAPAAGAPVPSPRPNGAPQALPSGFPFGGAGNSANAAGPGR